MAGLDPVAVLTRLGDRVIAIPVKDTTQQDEKVDQAVVGACILPSRSILDAAPSTPWQLIAGSGSLEGGFDGIRVGGLGSPGWGWWRAEV